MERVENKESAWERPKKDDVVVMNKKGEHDLFFKAFNSDLPCRPGMEYMVLDVRGGQDGRELRLGNLQPPPVYVMGKKQQALPAPLVPDTWVPAKYFKKVRQEMNSAESAETSETSI